MSQMTDEHHATINSEDRGHVNNTSKPSLHSDLEPAAVKEEAVEERLEILIQGRPSDHSADEDVPE